MSEGLERAAPHSYDRGAGFSDDDAHVHGNGHGNGVSEDRIDAVDASFPVADPLADPLVSAAAPRVTPPRSADRPVLAGGLLVLALAWLVLCGIVVARTAAEANLVNMVSWAATMSVPLVLLGLVWLIFGRTGRVETERFTRSVALMREEAASLDHTLAAVADRLASNRVRLGEETAQLATLGEEASDRIGRVTHHLSREVADLGGQAQALDAAAAQARVDLGILLADLPQAEQAARSFSETMREAGVSAHDRARALEAQLSAITARATDANVVTGGAAERLGAHIARIEASAGGAAQQLEGAAVHLDTVVDGALARASDAVEATRVALAGQGHALVASVEEGRARLADVDAEASRSLDARLAAAQHRLAETGVLAGQHLAEQLALAQQRIGDLGDGIAAQEAAGRTLAQTLGRDLAVLDEQLADLGGRTESQSAQMATALAGLRDTTAELRREVGASGQEAAALVGRTQDMTCALDTVAARLRGELVPALAEVEARAAAGRDAALAAVEPVQAMHAAAVTSADRLAETEVGIARQRAELEALIGGLTDAVGGIEDRLRAIAVAAQDADDSASVLVRETGPELVEALLRVREAARAAAEHAREAITGVIPDAASSLAEAVGKAVDGAATEAVRQQIAELDATSQRTATAARKASERLTRQLLTLGESAAALEARIEEERGVREEHDRGGMGRRVALLMESLNSTAIDVTKILSNDVTDTAWSAYLKGDRGVFTRRAVRLLEAGEAREVTRHYEEEPEFRDQVNRYVHDFEAMLRRVLADREGDSLSVTLLSSDMGKLYVALAQAIERLRK